MNKLFIIVVLGFIGNIGIVVSQYPEVLRNAGVYTFLNRGDRGFLTSVGRSNMVVTDVWRETGAQKWRAIKAYTSTTYMFKPTSEESSAIYTESRKTYDHKHVVVKGSSGLGVSNTQYWTVVKAEFGFFNLRNSNSNECLESGGLGRGVVASRCVNSPLQQWALHLL